MQSSIEIGSCRLTLVRAGVYHWDGGALFGVVPKTLWHRHLPADELNRVPMAFNCYVVETGEHTVLIETGGGDKMDARARERMLLPDPVPLPDILAGAGFDPERIDTVLNSHLHWDHCGWNTVRRNGAWEAAFPNAVYYAPAGEYEQAKRRHPRDSVSYLDANYVPLLESGRMHLLGGAVAEVLPGIGMHRAPGHTRDMRVVLASSGGRTFCFFADLVPTAAHVKPTWVTGFDLFPLETIDTKLDWLDRAASGGWICAFAHDTGPAFYTIENRGGNYVASPLGE